MKKTLNITELIVIIILILWCVVWFLYIPKINYLSHVIDSQNEKQKRLVAKSIVLDKHINFYVPNKNYTTQIYLNNYKNYFTINGNYCDIDTRFFTWIASELAKKHIIYKPKLVLSSQAEKLIIWSENIQTHKNNTKTDKNSTEINKNNIEKIYNNYWKQIDYEHARNKICDFIFSTENMWYIPLETKTYSYSSAELETIKNYILVWKYSIDLYEKTPAESVKNTQTLIDKMSQELIYPWEYVSTLDTLWNKNGSDLLESNILDKGQIIQWVGWWSCLASSIVYRTLLDAGIEVVYQKAHNIYYENIYWIDEIGLDSTIFQDDDYRIDLLFKNNYSSPIIFVPRYWDKSITLEVFALTKEYTTALESISLKNTDKIEWKYSVYDDEKKLVLETLLLSKYDAIDDY